MGQVGAWPRTGVESFDIRVLNFFLQVTDLTSQWSDGLALCRLALHHDVAPTALTAALQVFCIGAVQHHNTSLGVSGQMLSIEKLD